MAKRRSFCESFRNKSLIINIADVERKLKMPIHTIFVLPVDCWDNSVFLYSIDVFHVIRNSFKTDTVPYRETIQYLIC